MAMLDYRRVYFTFLPTFYKRPTSPPNQPTPSVGFFFVKRPTLPIADPRRGSSVFAWMDVAPAPSNSDH